MHYESYTHKHTHIHHEYLPLRDYRGEIPKKIE